MWLRLPRKFARLWQNVHKPLRVAVMGCVVNGPGEAADADIALCCGKDKAFLYRSGEKIATVGKDNW